jgi:hypothetical protein
MGDAVLKPSREWADPRVLSPRECYVLGTAMRFHRLSKLLLTLLLAASLPLRAYAAPCESPAAHAALTAHTAHATQAVHAAHRGTHCEHGSMSGHGATCDCCGVAVAAPPPSWAPPHDSASAVLARPISHSPVLTLDRLDRPPRLSA